MHYTGVCGRHSGRISCSGPCFPAQLGIRTEPAANGVPVMVPSVCDPVSPGGQ